MAAGLITEEDLKERSALTDTQVTRAFIETQKALDELD